MGIDPIWAGWPVSTAEPATFSKKFQISPLFSEIKNSHHFSLFYKPNPNFHFINFETIFPQTPKLLSLFLSRNFPLFSEIKNDDFVQLEWASNHFPQTPNLSFLQYYFVFSGYLAKFCSTDRPTRCPQDSEIEDPLPDLGISQLRNSGFHFKLELFDERSWLIHELPNIMLDARKSKWNYFSM